MEITKNKAKQILRSVNSSFVDHLWEKSWTYIKSVVDVVREPVLILDKDFRVMVANEPFYLTFKVKPKDTENKIVYQLGNGQWNIPSLKKLLEDILSKDTFFKGFEVTHEFPLIGNKIMILNARQIYIQGETGSASFPPIILLAMEDVTEMMDVAEMLARHTKQFEETMAQRANKLEVYIEKLEKEINGLKKII
ncbi:MAG: hypothetical protein WC657_01400 [Candidatus Paceibacterota bacterium]|jgi:hypothetical protein